MEIWFLMSYSCCKYQWVQWKISLVKTVIQNSAITPQIDCIKTFAVCQPWQVWQPLTGSFLQVWLRHGNLSMQSIKGIICQNFRAEQCNFSSSGLYKDCRRLPALKLKYDSPRLALFSNFDQEFESYWATDAANVNAFNERCHWSKLSSKSMQLLFK